MSFTPFNSHSLPYFQDYNIFKFCDVVTLKPVLSLTIVLIVTPQSLLKDLNLYQNLMLDHPVKAIIIKAIIKVIIFVPSYNTSRFGRKSVICSATLIKNHFQNKYSNHDFIKLALKALKNFLTQKLTSFYCQQ